jgi:nucleotide-binding universal stress UspA family protein
MKVLLATDGMPHTDKTVEYAIDHASKYGAALFILYVLCLDRDQKAAYAEGKDTVESIRMKALSRKVGVTTMLEAGEPAETIVKIADRIDASVIIMGASGKCMEDRHRPLGSVSGKVAQNACCSVIIVR